MIPKFRPEDCFLGTLNVGERGQIVIPAEARKKLDIHTGDKLFIVSHPSGDGLAVFKIDAMREFLNHLAAGLSMAERNNAGSEHSSRAGRKSRARTRAPEGED